jgi:deoxyhypusine synthase
MEVMQVSRIVATIFVCNNGPTFEGARPDEAVSWGKIRPEATPVKVYCDATLVFPLIVQQTFYKVCVLL